MPHMQFGDNVSMSNILLTFKDLPCSSAPLTRPYTATFQHEETPQKIKNYRANYKCGFHLLPSGLQTKALFIVSKGYSQLNSVN